MTRHRERGSVVLYFAVAFVLSVAVGVGVYLLLRDRAREKASIDVIEKQRAPTPVPRTPEPVETTPVVDDTPVEAPAAEATPLEQATRDATDAPEAPNSIVFGTPGVAGELQQAAVARVVVAQKQRLQRCVTPGSRLDGAMRVQLVVDARGKVSYAAALDGELGAAFTRCVLDKLKRTAFPPAVGATTIVIPLRVRYDG